MITLYLSTPEIYYRIHLVPVCYGLTKIQDDTCIINKLSYLTTTYRSSAQSQVDLIQIRHRAPAFRDETLLGDVQVEEIEGVVDGLELAYLDEPHPETLGGQGEEALTMLLGLAQNLRGRGIKNRQELINWVQVTLAPQ